MFQHAAKLFLFIMLFASCKQKNDSAQIAIITQGLQNANSLVQDYNARLYLSFEQRSKEPMSSTWSAKWFPKIIEIKKLSSLVNLYIDSCINALTEGSKSEISTHDIYFKLFNYKRVLVNVFDPEEYQESQAMRAFITRKKEYLFAEIPVLASIGDTSTAGIRVMNEKRWLDSTFSDADIDMQRLMLYKIKNDVLISEQILLDFCFRSATDHQPHYEEVELITSLSSSIIKTGETLEVTAGIAIVNHLMKPRVTIDGKEVRLTGMGLTQYTFRPRYKPGKYTLPIIIEITNADGTIYKHQRKLSYTILP